MEEAKARVKRGTCILQADERMGCFRGFFDKLEMLKIAQHDRNKEVMKD